MSTSGGSSGGAILIATAHLTNTAINTLFSAPTTLVADPGANQMVDILEGTIEAVPGAAGNWAIPSQLGFYYGTPNGGATAGGPTSQPSDMLHGSALPNLPQIRNDFTGAGNFASAAAQIHLPVVVGCDSADPLRLGGLTAIAINNGGAGYVVNDTGTIDIDQYGGGAAYRVTTIGAAGTVTGVVLTAAGTGYGQGDTGLTTTAAGSQPGIGTGLTVNATTVIQPLGDLYVTTSYRIITTH